VSHTLLLPTVLLYTAGTAAGCLALLLATWRYRSQSLTPWLPYLFAEFLQSSCDTAIVLWPSLPAWLPSGHETATFIGCLLIFALWMDEEHSCATSPSWGSRLWGRRLWIPGGYLLGLLVALALEQIVTTPYVFLVAAWNMVIFTALGGRLLYRHTLAARVLRSPWEDPVTLVALWTLLMWVPLGILIPAHALEADRSHPLHLMLYFLRATIGMGGLVFAGRAAWLLRSPFRLA
jgi:hypothetical protein